jgi:hypothetical protein
MQRQPTGARLRQRSTRLTSAALSIGLALACSASARGGLISDVLDLVTPDALTDFDEPTCECEECPAEQSAPEDPAAGDAPAEEEPADPGRGGGGGGGSAGGAPSGTGSSTQGGTSSQRTAGRDAESIYPLTGFGGGGGNGGGFTGGRFTGAGPAGSVFGQVEGPASTGGAQSLADQAIVAAQSSAGAPGASFSNPLLPIGGDSATPPFQFQFDVVAGGTGDSTPLYVDPYVAIGYIFQIDSGPNFESVEVPEPLPNTGQAEFTLIFGNETVALIAGEPFYFTQYDPDGVSEFTITGISPLEGLDPNAHPADFVVALTFVGDGPVSFSMTPVVSTPEPASLIMAGTAAAALFGWRLRRGDRRRQG